MTAKKEQGAVTAEALFSGLAAPASMNSTLLAPARRLK